VTPVLVPTSAVPVLTGGATTVPALGYEEVTEEPPTISGLVTFQETVVVQLLAPEAIVQLGAERVPDIPAGGVQVE
jgi:hypothetical protein